MDVDVRNIVIKGSSMQTSEGVGGKGGCLKHTCSEASHGGVVKKHRKKMAWIKD